ncbi:MAG: threonine/serine exporter family protein [Firmicutes bacterium]|nr:threonine/serine exporter family protein [Bacillota bacterium]
MTDTIILQLAMAFLGSFSFSLVFHLRSRLWLATGLGGLIGWGSYLLCGLYWEGVFVPSLIAAGITSLYGEILARILKAPAPVFFIPSLVPLIPGGSLYRTMSFAVRGEWTQAKIYSAQTVQAALAIAIGISLVWAFCVMATRIRRHILLSRGKLDACGCPVSQSGKEAEIKKGEEREYDQAEQSGLPVSRRPDGSFFDG